MSAELFAIGTAVPRNSVLQTEACQLAQDLGISQRWHRALPALYKKTGVTRRGSVLLEESESGTLRQSFYAPASEIHPRGPSTQTRMEKYALHAPKLIAEACLSTLDQSSLAPTQITHLVSVSCTGFVAPGVDFELIQSLGLDSSISRTTVGFMGCHGAINGLRVAQGIAISNPHARVLVAAIELCSIHQQFSDNADQLVANALFADGAASCLVSSQTVSDGRSSNQYEIEGGFSLLVPDTQDQMSWKIGDFGFEMTLATSVPHTIENTLREKLIRFLASKNLSIRDIEGWAVHPGGPRILDAVQYSLELDDRRLNPSRTILAQHGNMSSPTVLFIIDEILKTSSPSRIVVLAFGPGLQIECLLLKHVH